MNAEALNYKCKMKLARAEVRALKAQVAELKDNLAFKEKALVNATFLIERLDKNGDLWKALMGTHEPFANSAQISSEENT